MSGGFGDVVRDRRSLRVRRRGRPLRGAGQKCEKAPVNRMPFQPRNGRLPVEALRVLNVLESVIPELIVGAYLHGSLVAGGLRPQSDIDVLVIASEPLSGLQRKALVDEFLKISGRTAVIDPSRPLEVTVVAIGEVVPWRFPPICDLVFGEWLRDALEADRIPPPVPSPDLAIVFSQLLRLNRLLAGEPAERVLDPVPAIDLRRAVAMTLPGIVAGAKGDQRNAILTLARMWVTAATGEIVSKDAAAHWARRFLPAHLAPVLATARAAYLGAIRDDWTTQTAAVEEFVAYAAGRIRAEL